MAPDLSVGRAVADLARRAPDTRSLVADDGRVLTAAELDRRADALAADLHAGGVRPGDRVAWAGRNDPGLILTLLAANRLGAVFVPLNFRLTTVEAQRTLDHAGPHTVVVETAVAPVYEPLRAAPSGAVTRWMTSEQATDASEGAARPPQRTASPDELAVIVHTSGTSGQPKGVMLTHANLWWSARSMSRVLGTQADDVVLVAAPLFHIAGLNCFTLDALSRGCTVLLRRSFDAPRTLYDLTHGVTTVFGVPAMYAALTRLPEFAHADLSGVRKAVVGGGPAQADLVGRLARSGMTVHPSWGMTELAGGGTVLSGDEAPAKPCSVGRPLPYLEVTLRADDSAVITEPGAPGEVWVRGPQVTRGYWQDPEATEAALTAEGWLRTKDLASWDVDGCLTLAGRTCEVINTGGEKVVPGEVEVALRTLPVDELVVVGAPDPLWGETVVVVVACAPDRVPSLEDVRASAGGTLAHYKMPTRVVAVAELPRTASGKVDRCAVRALAARAEI